MKAGRRSLILALGTLAFIAAFVWLLTTRGPLAPVCVEITSVTQGDLNRADHDIGTQAADHPG